MKWFDQLEKMTIAGRAVRGAGREKFNVIYAFHWILRSIPILWNSVWRIISFELPLCVLGVCINYAIWDGSISLTFISGWLCHDFHIFSFHFLLFTNRFIYVTKIQFSTKKSFNLHYMSTPRILYEFQIHCRRGKNCCEPFWAAHSIVYLQDVILTLW